MTSTTRVPAVEITGLYGTVVKTFSKKMFGKVPAVARRALEQPAGAQVLHDARPEVVEVARVRRGPEVLRAHGGRRP